MKRPTSDKFREILNSDGYAYTVTSKQREPIDINYPNLPRWHKDEFEEWRHEILPDATVICFEHNGSNYKLTVNMGDADCNDGNFGAVFDGNNEKVLDLLSTGDMETTLESLINNDPKLADDFIKKLAPYLEVFEVVLANHTAFEYLVFKILAENRCLIDIDEINGRFEDDHSGDDETDDDDSNEDH